MVESGLTWSNLVERFILATEEMLPTGICPETEGVEPVGGKLIFLAGIGSQRLAKVRNSSTKVRQEGDRNATGLRYSPLNLRESSTIRRDFNHG